MRSKVSTYILLIFFTLLPVVLIVLPATFFDKGTTVCLSQVLFHRACPGCGITRATMHLIHFDYTGAMQYNKLVLIVLPLLIFVYIQEMARLYKAAKHFWAKG